MTIKKAEPGEIGGPASLALESVNSSNVVAPSGFDRIDPRIEEACATILASLQDLKGRESEESLQMDVCLTTRTAEATFLDIARWSGEFSKSSTEQARKLLVESLKIASDTLYGCQSAYYNSVKKRLSRISAYPSIPADE